MSAVRTFRDWNAIAAMLARMIDRASDFCKYSSGTDYRATAKEPHIWDQVFISDSHEEDK